MDCNSSYAIDEVIFRCPSCNGLLDVHHSIEPLKQITALEWKNRFVERFRSSKYPLNSGVWSKKEWVLPYIKDEQIVSLGEGATPLVPLKRLSKTLRLSELWVKQCGVSATGSFKDLGMTVLVSHVNALRQMGKPIKAVACASTGDTSAALAAYGALADIPVIIFLPEGKITTAQLVQPLANGAKVIQLNTDFDGCMEIVKQVTEDKEAGIYLANSMNPLRIEGQKTVGIEVVQQLGWQVPDWIIIPGGNLGNVSALAAGFDLLVELGLVNKRPQICVAQAENANPLYRSFQTHFQEYNEIKAKQTLASAIQIGAPVSYRRAVRALEKYNGVVEQATEDELSNAAARADREGLFNDPHTGVALAALEKLIESKTIAHDSKVVIVSTAHGLKFQEFKTGYHQSKLQQVTSKYANQPMSCEANLDQVKRHLDSVESRHNF
ncbi:MAG: threonine synthase [Leptonema sp. (in: Bacteria)]|nr:threonine synthase [Leptonema sp. (in: bacteria)]